MEFTLEDLHTLSGLARIDIKEEEKEKMLLDMQAILGYISEINEVTANLVKEKEPFYNIVRDDIVTRDIDSNREALLAVAPKVKDGYVEVEQVLK